MKPNELKKLVKDGKCPKCLIFTGPETYVKNFYIKKINPIWQRVDDIKDLDFKSKNLFNTGNYYLIDGESLNRVKDLQNLKEVIFRSLHHCIFNYIQDKPSKEVVELFEDYLVTFDHLNESLLLKEFEYTKLSDENLIKLFEYNDYDYTKIKLEIDKILAFTEASNITPDMSFVKLMNEGQLHRPIGDVLFDFTGAIMRGAIKDSNYWLYMIKKSGEPLGTILKTLYDNFRSLYLVKASQGKPAVRADIGIEQNRIWGISKNLSVYTLDEIERNINLLQYVEAGSKTGDIDQNSALDYLVVNLLSR